MKTVYTILCLAVLMVAVETVAPGRKWQKVAHWWRRAFLLNGIQIGAVYLSALTWDRWMEGQYLWNVEGSIGVAGGAALGYFVITFIYYWWHRARHDIDFLWRWFHQIHHSPARIEIITSFYKHPIEIIANGIISSSILYMLLGLSAEAATIAVFMTGVGELFYHWNIKTPYLLGFVFQRPESHCIHHQRDWHKNNFSDLPLWDILFKTFHNPKVFDKECGFSEEKELRLKDMLIGQDISHQ